MTSSGEDAGNFLKQLDDIMQSISPERLLQGPTFPGLQPKDAHSGSGFEDSNWIEPEESNAEDSGDDNFTKSYAKSDSQVCKYCEKFLLVVTKGNKDDSSYKFPDHFEWFWNMKKSSKTCGLCWNLIKSTEEHLKYSSDVLPRDRNMVLSEYELYVQCIRSRSATVKRWTLLVFTNSR